MLNTLVNELFAIVNGLVQSDYKSDSKFLKDWDVVIGGEGAVPVGLVERS
jgi:hypothetical protein